MAEPIAPYVSQDLYLPRDFDDEFSELLVSGKRGSDKPFRARSISGGRRSA